jgi:DNA-binding response OmpR family regulator
MRQRLVDEPVPSEILDEAGEGARESPDRKWSYVLVVDDDPAIREFLKRRLESWGYNVKQAGTALDALETMAARAASVVLCDIKMPTHDGLWLTERLREQWPDTPIVMTTALDDVDTVSKSRELGAFDYLTKPIDPEQLRRTVQRATSAHDESGLEPTDATSSPMDELHTQFGKIEAEYSLECPVRCPTCGETVTSVKAVRLLRAHVNFTSTLPRRGRLVACPHCFAVIPAELSNF